SCFKSIILTMKTSKPILLALIVLIVITFALLFFFQNKEESSQTTPEESIITEEVVEHELITIEYPIPNQQITSPLLIRGEARGFWFFEADAPAILADENGNIIAQGHIQAQGDWMTEDFVFFEGKIIFETEIDEGTLILEKANP